MKKSKKVILAVVVFLALAVTAVVVCLAVLFLRKPTIDLNKFAVVQFEGYDGSGSAKVSLDYERINEEYGNKVRINFDQIWLDFLYEGSSVGTVLDAWTTLTLDRDSGLSNGDVLTVTCSADVEYLEQVLSCHLSCGEHKVTVEGLGEISTLDVFEGVDVSFTGTSPKGQAKIVADNPYDKGAYGFYHYYQVEPEQDLSNGDEVTVTFEIDNEQAFIEEFGGLPGKKEKKFKVEGLDSYITDFALLSKENMEALTKEAKDQIEAECSTNEQHIGYVLGDMSIVHDITLESDFHLENIYFLLRKDADLYGFTDNVSRVVLVYSAKINTLDYKGDVGASGTVYFAVAFTDLVLEDDGSIVGVSENRIQEYESLDAVYKKYVTENKDNYTITVYDSDLKETKGDR